MPNECSYEVKIIAESEDTLRRMLKIMNTYDEEFCVPGVQCMEWYDGGFWEEDGCWCIVARGFAEYSCEEWILTENELTEDALSFVNLLYLCKKLNIALDIFSEDNTAGYQEHVALDNSGNIVKTEWVPWHDGDLELRGTGSTGFLRAEELFQKKEEKTGEKK